MIRPELMSLMKILIHQSEVPIFLNEILKFRYFEIREFSPPKKTDCSHYWERSMVVLN
jgi:hypothetical protein